MQSVVKMDTSVIKFVIFFSELNECKENLDDCSENEDCEDNDTSYTCKCKEGYAGTDCEKGMS